MHEVKFDGWRIQIRVEDGSAQLLTRNGLDWTKKFPALAKQARGFDNCIIDGELCSIDAAGLPDFAALQAAMKSDETDDLIYFAFDCMFDGSTDRCGEGASRDLTVTRSPMTDMRHANMTDAAMHLRHETVLCSDS